MDQKDKKNADNFSSSLRIENKANFKMQMPLQVPDFRVDEEQELKASFNNLRINSVDNSSVLGKRSAAQAHSVVEIKRVNKKFEKLLNQNMLEFAAHYVNNMTKTSSQDWQISRSFVTNMVEVLLFSR